MDESEPKYVVNSMKSFKPGECFNSFEDLKERMEAHSREDFVFYWLRDSRTVAGAFMKTSRPIEKRLKYYSCRYACVFGGQKFHTRGHGRRNAQTIRNNCPAHVTLRASKCGTQLEVTSVCNTHNHEVSEASTKLMRHTRKLTPELRLKVQRMIGMKINWDTIMEYFKLRYDKQLSKKDLFNIAGSKKFQKDIIYDEKDAEEMQRLIDDFIEKQRQPEGGANIIIKSENKIESRTASPDLITSQINSSDNIDDNLIEYIEDESDAMVDDDSLTINYIQEQEIDDPSHFKYIQHNGMELLINDSNGEFENEFSIDVNYLVKNDFLDHDVVTFQIENDFTENLDMKPCTNNITEVETISCEMKDKEPDERAKLTHRKRVRSTLDKEYRRTKRKISNCRTCGTQSRLLKHHIDLLVTMKKKLKSETEVLQLRKRKLKLEIRNLLNAQK